MTPLVESTKVPSMSKRMASKVSVTVGMFDGEINREANREKEEDKKVYADVILSNLEVFYTGKDFVNASPEVLLRSVSPPGISER